MPTHTWTFAYQFSVLLEISYVSMQIEQTANAMIINILQESYSLFFFDKMFVVLTVLQIYKKVAEITSSISREPYK